MHARRLTTCILLLSASVAASNCSCRAKPEVDGIVAIAGSEKVRVDWQLAQGAASYDVYWDDQPDIDPRATPRVERLTAPPLVHEPLVNGRRYCYRVAANLQGELTRPSPVVCVVPSEQNKPELFSLDPAAFPPGEPFSLVVTGAHFSVGAHVVVDGQRFESRVMSESHILVAMPAIRRGLARVVVEQGIELSNPLQLVAADAPPQISDPGSPQVAEGELLELRIDATDPEAGEVRLFVEGLPPGARWSESARTLSFRPTFSQGGRRWRVVVHADDGVHLAHRAFDLEVLDTIRPPDPTVSSTRRLGSGCEQVSVYQRTDTFLDSQGHAGRSFDAQLVVPDGASAENRMPVRIHLHGFGSRTAPECSTREFRLYPTDPDNTYWWGYSDQLPGGAPVAGAVPDYTARRVLHLLDWVLRSYPGADPERVYVVGGSMGAAGAMQLGLLYARHFAFVQAFAGQTVARLHRPSRLAQLESLWGAQSLDLPGDDGVGVWDALDLTRALTALPEAQDQFVYVKHGKDDPTIHFSAAVGTSALTGLSFYEALSSRRVGHYAIWDEAGHSEPDPVLGQRWWDSGWDPVHDPAAFVRRDRAFPAFTHCSGDRTPGDEVGNGARAWSADSGFAGAPAVAGDTGWSGDPAGALNRFLRWDARALVDTRELFELPLRLLDGAGAGPPRDGYPTTGDRLEAGPTLTVDVTIRRARGFVLRAGETVRWRFGGLEGTAQADDEGLVTIPRVPVSTQWTTLGLERE